MTTPTPSSLLSSQPLSRSTARYHPYSLNSDLLNYRRNGTPSIASTSYAPSIASTATTVIPTHVQLKQNNLRLKVNTSVAPSSHIWDEFYKEHGRPHNTNKTGDSVGNDQQNENGRGRTDHVQGKLTPRQATTSLPSSDDPIQTDNFNFGNGINEDTALTEILSMFNIPSTTNYFQTLNSNNGTSSHQQTVDNHGDYPGAEFLNLPDTGSTIDAQFPVSDQFDFSQFDFGITPTLTSSQPIAIPSNSDNLGIPISSDKLENFATHITEGAHDNEISLDSSNLNMGISPLDKSSQLSSYPSSSVEQNKNDGKPTSSSTTLSVPLQTSSFSFSSNTSISESKLIDNIHLLPNEENNKASSSSNKTCTPSNTSNTNSFIPISSSSYPHLKRIKMKALMQDKDVIRFQKEVLKVAARFYTDLGDIFENTPNDIIKLGMSRTGILAEDDAVSDVLEDIKSLCSRLTAKAADIPGYPSDDEDVTMGGEEAIDHSVLPRNTLKRGSLPLSQKMHQRGSLKEPIDLTASTPRSEDATPAVITDVLVPASMTASTPHPIEQIPSVEIDNISTPQLSPPDLRSRPIYDPFTPESLAAGPSSVMPFATTSSPLYPGSTPSQLSNAYTPSAQSLQAPTPSSKLLLDLPPLNAPVNKVVHGPWKPSEVERLRTLVAFSQDVEDNAPVDHTDWTWVVDNFGGTRNRHQVLIKAVELGLRETSTHHSRRVKQKGYRDAVAAMETELKATSSQPLRSPLPPLLPSAQVTSRRAKVSGAPTACINTSSPSSNSADITIPPTSDKVVKTPLMLGEGGRRESNTSPSSEPVHTPYHPDTPLPRNTPRSKRTLPRALDLSSLPSNPNIHTTMTSPIRSGTSPYAPRSKISTMGFKPYANPHPHQHSNIPSTAPPRSTYPIGRHNHGRTLSGWRLVNMASEAEDGIRPSVISPTFGGYALKGYQLAPIPVFEGYEGNENNGVNIKEGIESVRKNVG